MPTFAFSSPSPWWHKSVNFLDLSRPRPKQFWVLYHLPNWVSMSKKSSNTTVPSKKSQFSSATNTDLTKMYLTRAVSELYTRFPVCKKKFNLNRKSYFYIWKDEKKRFCVKVEHYMDSTFDKCYIIWQFFCKGPNLSYIYTNFENIIT